MKKYDQNSLKKGVYYLLLTLVISVKVPFEYNGENQLLHTKVAHVYGLVMIERVRKSLTVRSDGILSLIMT